MSRHAGQRSLTPQQLLAGKGEFLGWVSQLPQLHHAGGHVVYDIRPLGQDLVVDLRPAPQNVRRAMKEIRSWNEDNNFWSCPFSTVSSILCREDVLEIAVPAGSVYWALKLLRPRK